MMTDVAFLILYASLGVATRLLAWGVLPIALLSVASGQTSMRIQYPAVFPRACVYRNAPRAGKYTNAKLRTERGFLLKSGRKLPNSPGVAFECLMSLLKR